MPLGSFHLLKVEPKFIEEMKAVMPYLSSHSWEILMFNRMNDHQSFYFLCMNSIYFFSPFLCGIKIVERDINQKEVFLLTVLLPTTYKTFKEEVAHHVTSR